MLVESAARFDASKLFGRTPENRAVAFVGDAVPGSVVKVKIEKTSPNGLNGVQVALVEAPPQVAPKAPALALPVVA